ncbi:sugar ABC transporter permease [Paenibacillus sp. IB182496]|uniref:Sugar ABC transporter permease n=1 Tax=Paenibacillus sabuli TaxID=2772509 RepID=A0A927GRJ6_9BACL|nr:ABC transporter permease subunit [Paenibacillus sabuli]MBD2845568.1 sugar ABC transporter permease [Paenibacillus sabuli]
MQHIAQRAKLLLTKHQIYFFIVPAIAFYAIFKYKPLYFIQIAFKDFRVTRPLEASPWVGFEHFATLFQSPDFQQALLNTVIISFYKLLFGFPAPILLALMLNELRHAAFKRISQSILYLPHFLSWAVLGGIVYNLFSVHDGLVNHVLGRLGYEPIYFLGSTEHFRSLLVLSDVWKTMGWGTILYLAALSRIDTTLYEAAYVDGASKLQRLWHITLPGISTTIVVLFIINIGHLLDVGFEQIMVMGNALVRPVSDIIDTYVFRVGLQEGKHSLATAAGLFKTLVAGVMVFAADRIAKMIGHRGII